MILHLHPLAMAELAAIANTPKPELAPLGVFRNKKIAKA